jgi:intergrase/recombinase
LSPSNLNAASDDDWSSSSSLRNIMEQELNVMDEALLEILAEIRAAQERAPRIAVSMSPTARKEYVSNVLIVKVRHNKR